MCVIAKFGDAPGLSPNGTFLSRFQKCNPSFRTSPLRNVMLRWYEPSSEALPQSEASVHYYKISSHSNYLRTTTSLIYAKVLLHVITNLYCIYTSEFHAKECIKKDILLRPSQYLYRNSSYSEVLAVFVQILVLQPSPTFLKFNMSPYLFVTITGLANTTQHLIYGLERLFVLCNISLKATILNFKIDL